MAVVLQVARDKDGGHPAGAGLALDGILLGERRGEPLECIRHRARR